MKNISVVVVQGIVRIEVFKKLVFQLKLVFQKLAHIRSRFLSFQCRHFSVRIVPRSVFE